MVKREKRTKFEYRGVALAVAIVVIGLINATPSIAGVHDPMRPQVESVAADSVALEKTEFHLEATMVSVQRRVAIIDGSTVSVGDQYQGHSVTSINEGCVVLAQRGKKTSLTLQPIIKTRTDAVNGMLHHLRGVE
ncbi:MAG: hypothetical protein B6I37_04715 [Desulfobacteraceae bacterium 4572_35.2]|nr:MAG: hypothetical protein B6I37_04715 [Desulfobacteraceae bacterium 4572_35.2]